MPQNNTTQQNQENNPTQQNQENGLIDHMGYSISENLDYD